MELFEVGKMPFFPKKTGESDFQFGVVDFVGEAQEVHFKAALGLSAGDCWSQSDVRNSANCDAAETGEDCVDAVGRGEKASDV